MSDNNEYTTVKLPKEFVEAQIDELMNEPKNGFTSRADVIKNAVRNLYQTLKPEPVKK